MRKFYNDGAWHGKLSWILIFVLIIAFSLFAVQGYNFYHLSSENKRMLALKAEYKLLLDEIEEYELLKSQYETVTSEGSDLKNNKETLNKKYSSLQKDISALEKKIADVNNKIKKMS